MDKPSSISLATIFKQQTFKSQRAVVVAQLVEPLLQIPEVRGSNPAIGNIYIEHLFTCLPSTVLINKKRPEMAHFRKNLPLQISVIIIAVGRFRRANPMLKLILDPKQTIIRRQSHKSISE